MSGEYLRPINPYSSILSASRQGKAEKRPAGTEFSDLLMSMFSTSSFSGVTRSEGSTGLGASLSSLMMPMMLSLLEKMQAMQVEAGGEIEKAVSKNPVAGGELTQKYHSGHQALDFGVAEGTPVRSTMAGKVVFSGWNDQGYGNLVIVENGNRRTYYAHLSELPVSEGQQVKAGDVIGLSGNTGNSTGPHLHYEIRVNGMAIDPTGEVYGQPGS